MKYLIRAVVVLCAAACSAPEPPPNEGPTLIVLVRHAEKEDASSDPELSEAGERRAEVLAGILADAGIERILSTDYLRTLQTGAPLRERLGIQGEIYDPRKLDQLVQELVASRKNTLVIGHSNTTPQLVRLLGGEAPEALDEDDYDRLYLVYLERGSAHQPLQLHGGGNAGSILLHYPPFARPERTD